MNHHFHRKSASFPTLAIGLRNGMNWTLVWRGGGGGRYPMGETAEANAEKQREAGHAIEERVAEKAVGRDP